MFFSPMLCFNSNDVDKKIPNNPSMLSLWLRLGSLCGSLQAGKCQAERGWRARCSYFLQPGTVLGHVLQPQVCPRPPFHPHLIGKWKRCNCKIFCWLARHEENFPGHELESKKDLCTSPPRRCYQRCHNTRSLTLPQRLACCSAEIG